MVGGGNEKRHVRKRTVLSTRLHFAFRLDASEAIGTGHLMRCLTLARELKEHGHQITFVARGLSSELAQLVLHKGHDLVNMEMPRDKKPEAQSPYHEWLGIDWQEDAKQTIQALNDKQVSQLIVDHYGIDEKWETAVKQAFPRQGFQLFVIDDLANRKHNCDVLVDQSLGRTSQEYRALVPEHTRLLVGVEYVLLRPEFAELRPKSLARRENPRLESIMISMGGTDENNISGKVLKHFISLGLHQKCSITVILGSLAPHYNKLKEQACQAEGNIRILQNVSNMADLLADTDIAVGAGGMSAWERTHMGVPSYVVLLAENQRKNASELEKSGAAIVVEDIETMFVKTLDPEAPETLQQLSGMSRHALAIGVGNAHHKVVHYLMGMCDA